MVSGRFCAKCGRKVSSQTSLLKGLCTSCYIETYGFARLPQSLTVTVCGQCGAYKAGGRWLPSPGGLGGSIQAAVEAALLPSVSPTPEVSSLTLDELGIHMESSHSGSVVARFSITFRNGDKAEREASIPLKVSYGLCPQCVRRAGKVYEAIIQVRSEGGRLSHRQWLEVERFLSTLPRRLAESIGEVEELREGVDLKVTDQGAARVIAAKLRDRFAAKVIETHKVIGRRRDGKAKVRTTYSVRLPGITEGERLIYRGDLVTVERITGSRVYLRDSGGRLVTLKGEDLWRESVFEKIDPARLEEYMVTAVTGTTIHLMRMDTYETVEVPRSWVVPHTDLEPGVLVKVYRSGNKLYVLERGKYEPGR